MHEACAERMSASLTRNAPTDECQELCPGGLRGSLLLPNDFSASQCLGSWDASCHCRAEAQEDVRHLTLQQSRDDASRAQSQQGQTGHKSGEKLQAATMSHTV